jgi:hypothetical protein
MPLPLGLLLMPTHTASLQATAGDTLYGQWIARDAAQNIIDLTGATLTGQVRTALGGTLLLTLTLTNGGATGLITATAAPGAQTALLAAAAPLPADGSYKDAAWFDIQATQDGDIRTLIAGRLALRGEVTAP